MSKTSKESSLTPEKIREVFYYDSETGVLRWKIRPGPNTKVKASDVTGYLGNSGYLQTMFREKTDQTHRLIFAWFYGRWPKDQIDHINGIRTDNRIANLREVTHGENCKNKRLGKNNTSGCVGVRWVEDRSKWRAQIQVDNKYISLGMFIYLSDAIKVRKVAELKYKFHKNHGSSLG